MRQLALLGRVRVRVLQISFTQQVTRSLLEAVRLVLAVPDGQRQRELLPDAVFVHGTQGSPSQSLRLLVVRLQPDRLQFHVRLLGELVRLDDVVEFLEVARVERDQGPCPQHGLALVKSFAGGRVDGQRPEEAAQTFDITALFERLADLRHLLCTEVQHRQRRGWWEQHG